MVLGTVAIDPNRLLDQVPVWVGALRSEANRGLGELEIAVRRATDQLATAIAASSGLDELAPLEVLHAHCGEFRLGLEPLVQALGARLSLTLSTELNPLDLLADQLGGVPQVLIRAQRRAWDQSLHQGLQLVLAYAAGHVDGGGLVLSLLTELPPEVAGHTGEVAGILAERTAYLPARTEAAVVAWVAQVHREVDELLLTVVAPSPGAGKRDVSPAEQLEALLVKASVLGMAVKNPPSEPTQKYLARLQARLEEVARKRAESEGNATQRGARLASLTALARLLKVKIQKVPRDPADDWLDRLEASLRKMAVERKVPVPPELDGTVIGRSNALVDDTATTMAAPRADEVQRVRIATLLEKAAEAGLDLGRIPQVVSMDWIVDTEGKLARAIARQREERRSERLRKDTLRKDRIDWLFQQATRLGEPLVLPPFPTEDWLQRAEQRLTSKLLTPSQGGRVDPALRDRFRKIWMAASAAGVDLGTVPPEPDAGWLDAAEAKIAAAQDSTRSTSVPADERCWIAMNEGTVQEQRFELSEAPLSVGRTRNNGIQIRDDAGVSRRHCTIQRVKGHYVLRDLGSSLGTIVDGVQVEEIRLRGGERILVGDTELVFHAAK